MSTQSIKLKNKSGYCIVTNEIAQAFRKHPAVLGLYVFLLSLPDDWIFHKTWLRKELGLGIHKLNSYLKLLSNHCLIKTTQIRKSGKFADFEMEILGNKHFKIKKLSPLFDSPCYNNRNTETVLTDNSTYILNTNKVNNNKKSKTASSLKNEPPKKSYCPGTSELVISDESTIICNSKQLDQEKMASDFMSYASSNSWLRDDWKKAFIRWVEMERKEQRSLLKEHKSHASVDNQSNSYKKREIKPSNPSIAKEHLKIAKNKLRGIA